MDQGVRNLVVWGLCRFEDAITLGSTNPRKALAEQGIAVSDPGQVRWSEDHRVIETVLNGEVVFQQ